MASFLENFVSSAGKSDRKKQPYASTLSGDVKERYRKKISAIDDRDPYEISKRDWLHDVTQYPDISYFDICNYLVYTISYYTQEEMRAYKSLDAFNYFVHGWVHEISNLVINGHCLLTARVNHSMRLRETPNRPWIIAETGGKILSAHCTCMAGLSESCSHVSALMFAVESAVTIRNSKTVTEKKAYWLQPQGIDKVEISRVNDIDFTSMKSRKKKLDILISSTPSTSLPQAAKLQLCAENNEEPTEAEKDIFFKRLSLSGSRPLILSLVKPHSSKFIPKSLSEDYPILFSELVDENVFGMTRHELKEHCTTVADIITVCQGQAESVERSTRLQASSKMWFSFRAGRVTASRLKRVCHTSMDRPSESLIKTVCYPVEKGFSNAATQWGCNHERKAREDYTSYMRESHDNFNIAESGLILNTRYPYFGASPDGLVSCDCCGEGVIEIKCPYCKRQSTVKESAKDSKFCLTETEGRLRLKETHEYFYQVQMHMFMSNRDYCDFIVWTEKDLHWERIEMDVEFWRSKSMIATRFFKEVLLLELVGKHFSQPNPISDSPQVSSPSPKKSPLKANNSQQDLICVCQTPYDPEYDSVIGCDNDSCKYQWLHYSCIDMKRAPKGSWYCKECRAALT